MTKQELWAKIRQTTLTDRICNLYERWQDEKDYEDFDDYVKAMKKDLPETVKGSKRPFGFVFQCEDGRLSVTVKATATTLQLVAKSAN